LKGEEVGLTGVELLPGSRELHDLDGERFGREFFAADLEPDGGDGERARSGANHRVEVFRLDDHHAVDRVVRVVGGGRTSWIPDGQAGGLDLIGNFLRLSALSDQLQVSGDPDGDLGFFQDRFHGDVVLGPEHPGKRSRPKAIAAQS